MKRGTPLGGKYKGIYKMQTAEGTRYRVYFSAQIHGRRRFITRTCQTLTEAKDALTTLKAKSQLGNLPPRPADLPRVSDLVATMKAVKRRNRAPEGSFLYLAEIQEFFGPDTPVEKIDEVWVDAFKERLDNQERKGYRSGPLSNRSKDHRLMELRHLLRVANDKGIVKTIPRIRLYGKYGKRKYNVTREDFYRLVKLMPDSPKPHRAILWMAFFTGQRKSDLLRMRWEQIHSDGCSFRLIRYRSSKNSKDLAIPVPDLLQEELEKLVSARQQGNPWLFPNPKTGKPYTDLRSPLLHASTRLGIDPYISLHVIRHMAADGIMEATGDRGLVQAYMGWSSPAMVDVYTHSYNRAGDAAKKYNDLVTEELSDD